VTGPQLEAGVRLRPDEKFAVCEVWLAVTTRLHKARREATGYRYWQIARGIRRIERMINLLEYGP